MLNRIRDNVQQVRQRIAEAAERSGRTGDDVTLIAVTKYGTLEQTTAIIQAGCSDLGENRPQQLWDKAAAFSGDTNVRWHQIGHLQRNKVAKTLPIIDLLHSADSLRLLHAVDDAAAAIGKRQKVLLEVNVSGDAAKHGWKPTAMPDVVTQALEMKHIEIRGLMTMATLGGEPSAVRYNFASLRGLQHALGAEFGNAVSWDHLSMGMSADFEIAIEEGATMVRVGSALVK